METKSALPDRTELNRLAELYDLERYLFGTVSHSFRQNQTLSPYDFFAIVTWKSNRAKTKIKRGLAAADRTATCLMTEVGKAATPQAKVEVLLQVWGIGLAMASAILTVCYPEEFTVLDYRAWETLQAAAVEGLLARYPQHAADYIQYCRVCKRLAAQSRLSLRDLDRALWAKSWEDDLMELIADHPLRQQ